jgi:predicted RNA-binding protein (virulence factor B family)
MAIIGKVNKLRVRRGSSPGVYLDAGELGEILLPNRYVPAGIKDGEELEVFIYRDSEDRLVASTTMPRVTVDETATLRVVSVNPRVGAFLDWGLPKDLLLPFREQTGPVRADDEVMVRVYLDPKSQRIVASMKLDRDSDLEPPPYHNGQAVSFVITGRSPLGFKALVEERYPGLLYAERVAVPLRIGQQLSGFVRAVRPDGKIDLSLEEAGYRRIMPLAQRIIDELKQNGGRLGCDDETAPETIREVFGASKKAFKQALGRLYKARRIRFTKPGIELIDDSSWAPGHPPETRKPRS